METVRINLCSHIEIAVHEEETFFFNFNTADLYCKVIYFVF